LKFGNQDEIAKTMSPAKAPRRKNSKHEARNSKQFQKTKKRENSKRDSFGFGVLGFPNLGFILASVCFEFRYSDFGFVSLVAWRDKFSCSGFV